MNREILNQLLETSYREFKNSLINNIKNINTPQCIFDVFLKKCIEYHNQPVHNLREMKEKHSTKSKGDLFEFFCVRYLLVVEKYENVWPLKELPDILRQQL